MAKIALGHPCEAADPDCSRAVLAELILTFFFVFIGVGTAMSAEKTAGGGGRESVSALTAVATAQGLAVAVLTSSGLHISGGHLNPAVTLGMAAAGRITVFRSAAYVAAQLLGSASACLLLKYLTGGGLVIPVHKLAVGMGPLQGVGMEAVFTFCMLFSVYATILDPQKGIVAGMGPLLVGLIVSANTLAGGAFSGASMNPARSFGPAVASWDWTNHWVYWVGPILGSGLAGLVYENLFMVHTPVAGEDESSGFLQPVVRL